MGFAIREQMNGIAEAPGKTWFWELEEGVVAAGRCIQCGACVAACPSDSIGVSDAGLPKLVKMCTGCSACWDFCPRGGLRYEATWPAPDPESAPAEAGDPADWRIIGGKGEGLGVVQSSYSARRRPRSGGNPRAQDGGVVTAILCAALAAGDLDGVLLARESPTEAWKGVAHLATTPEQVEECGGSYYNPTMALAHLDLARYDLFDRPRIAVVGTPCEVQGIRAMQARSWSRGSSNLDAVVLTIALLCTKSFDYTGLMLRELRDKRGLDLADVGKVDVIHGKMIIEDRAGATLVSEPVRDFHGAALKGCDECADFVGRGADISVGSVGSGDGWSSVLVRTDAGARAWLRAAPELEQHDLERPEALGKLDAYDRKVTLANLRRDFDPDGPLFIDYAEHVSAYQGTDQAPVSISRPVWRPTKGPAEPVAAREVGVAGRVKDLAVPVEPAAERARLRTLVGECPTAWPELAGRWAAETLWGSWGAALSSAGMSQPMFAQIVDGYRPELWLWVMGERTWEHTASGLAGRLQRRAVPAQAGVAQAGVAQGGVAQGGVAQAGVAQAGVAQAGVAHAGVAQAGVAQAGVAQAGVAQAGVAQAGVAQAGVAQAGVA
ncbi:MAG: Coenzyme F420 hydrogenase/dehydrogenase, beta subunit C-terminal domain, partial [Acidimicrobiales bacterium]